MSFPEPIILAAVVLDTTVVLFFLMLFLIILSWSECDFASAQKCCSKVNLCIKVKIYSHIFVISLFFMNGYWLLMLINVPIIFWLMYKSFNVSGDSEEVIEYTDNQEQVQKYIRNCMVNLGFYLIFFFVFLYCSIMVLLRENPTPPENGQENEF